MDRRIAPRSRPVLVEEVIERDGSRSTHLRVFCPREGASMPLAACEECRDCVNVGAAPNLVDAVVWCGDTRTLDEGDAPSELPVGRLLTSNTLCVRRDLALSSAVSLFAQRDLASIWVVDEGNRLVGCLRDVDLVARGSDVQSGDVASAMSSAPSVVELATLREAVRHMAAHHLRSLAVVTAEGALLGVLQDLDALRLLATLSRRPSER